MKTTFKIIDGNLYEYDSNGKVIHSKDSNGFESWYDSKGNSITKKQFDKLNQVVTIAGRKYRLTLI